MMTNRYMNLNAVRDYVRQHSNLLQLVEWDVPGIDFRKDSGDTHTACSPFRDENIPSFKVTGEKFKDWGGQGHQGDIFTWAQIWHNISYLESIEYVAGKFNLDLAPFKREATPEEQARDRYITINRTAAEFCHELFKQNLQVRDDYFARSGFNLSRIEPYQVGYCPDRDLLINHLSHTHHISNDELEKLDFNRFDLWHNVITYPVHSPNGTVLWFYTREIKDGSPYLGMRSSHPLHDPHMLYGMHVARKQLRDNGGRLVVVEGQRDAIALQAAGMMTSSLSDKQKDFLKEFKISSIVLCLDNDKTGWQKAIDLVKKPVSIGDAVILIAKIPEIDTDPHEYWRDHGDEAIAGMVQSAVLPIEFYVDTRYTNSAGELSITEQSTFLAEIQEFLTNTTGVQLHMAASYLAKILRSTQEAILDYVAEIKVQFSQLYNTEAERSLLAACMRSPAILATARAAGVESESFTLSYHKRFFEAILYSQSQFAENYTPQLVLDHAMARWNDNKLPQLINVILEENWKYNEQAACEIVLDMWRRRTASEQANYLVSAARDLARPFTEIVEHHRKNLVVTTLSSRKQARTPEELANEFWEKFVARAKGGGNVIIGHPVENMMSINYSLGGIQNHYTVVAGDSGAGKSILGMNILKALAIDRGVPTLWIGQEMHSDENTMRLASIMTGLDNTRIQTASLTKNEIDKVFEARAVIAKSGYYMAKPMSGHIDEIMSIIDEYRWKYNIQAVIWDYIGLITTGPGQERWSREQVIGHASTLIKNRVVGDMGLPAIIIAQMNRDKFSAGQHKIAGSYRIIQDCDNFMWIAKKTQKQIAEDGAGKGNRYIEIGKRRGGVSDIKIHFNLMSDPGAASLRLIDCSPPSEVLKTITAGAAAA